MFFIILGTYTRWTFIIFSLVQRILLLIFQCHTVTHGTDLRRSPLLRGNALMLSTRCQDCDFPFPEVDGVE